MGNSVGGLCMHHNCIKKTKVNHCVFTLNVFIEYILKMFCLCLNILGVFPCDLENLSVFIGKVYKQQFNSHKNYKVCRLLL